MIKYFILFCGISFCQVIKSQSISIGVGSIYQKNEILVEMINHHQRTNSGRAFFSLNASIPLSLNLNFGANYEELRGWNFAGSTGDVAGFGYASSRMKLVNYGVFLDYNIPLITNRLFISPMVNINYQKFNPQQQDEIQITNVFDGSNTLGEYKGYAEVKILKGGQIITSTGIELKLRIFKGLHAFTTLKWSFGNKAFQEMFVHYSFKDVEQPTAHVANKGNAFIHFFGLSYDLKIMNPIFN